MKLYYGFFGNIFNWIIMAIALIGIIVIFNIISMYNAVDSNSYIYEVTTDSILQEYKDDNNEAESKYDGNIIKIYGTIEAIIETDNHTEIILVDSISSMLYSYQVSLVFTDTEELSQISTLDIGESITVVGKISSFERENITYTLLVKRCNYIKWKDNWIVLFCV